MRCGWVFQGTELLTRIAFRRPIVIDCFDDDAVFRAALQSFQEDVPVAREDVKRNAFWNCAQLIARLKLWCAFVVTFPEHTARAMSWRYPNNFRLRWFLKISKAALIPQPEPFYMNYLL